MIKLQHLQQFIAVSEHATLTEAARTLHRTPAALSMTLKKLEAELGGALFESERKQHMTPLGICMRDHAKEALESYHIAVQHITQFARGESGQVRIAAVPSITTNILPAAFACLSQDYPEIHIELRDIDSAAVVEAVKKAEIDIGFASLAKESTDFDAELLAEEPFVCVCQPGHPLTALSGEASWTEIERYPFITNGLCEQIKAEPVRALSQGARMHLHNVASLAAFVRAGFGVTLLPRLAASLMPDLAIVTLADSTAIRRLYMLSHPGRSLSPATSRLKNLVKSACDELNFGTG